MWCTALLCCAAVAHAGASESPAAPTAGVGLVVAPPTPEEATLLEDARDGTLDHMTLLDAALIASGLSGAAVPAAAKTVRALIAPAVARARTYADPLARGRALLRGLHGDVLRRYDQTASELDKVAAAGTFNCLSSALVFVIAADGLFDSASGMVSKFHAFARVRIGATVVDVETTTPDGFGADRKALMTDAYVRKIAGPGVRPAELLADLEHPDELPVLSLVAALYSNRAVGLANDGDLNAAATALDRATRLASGALKTRAAAWRASILNNGAALLVEEKRLEDARALLELALRDVDPATRAVLARNLSAVLRALADAALASHDAARAEDLLRRAALLNVDRDEVALLTARARAQRARDAGADGAACETASAKPAATRTAALCLAELSRDVRPQKPDDSLRLARRAFTLAPNETAVRDALFWALYEASKAARAAGKCDAVAAYVADAEPVSAAAHGQPWNPSALLGTCLALKGAAAFDAHEYAVARAYLERAAHLLPDDDAIAQNLAAASFNQALPLARASRCDEARPHLRRAEKLNAALHDDVTRALEACATQVVKAAADRKQYDEAVRASRRGLIDAPQSTLLRANLKAMLHNVAATHLREGACADARALVAELRQVGDVAAVDAISRRCPPP